MLTLDHTVALALTVAITNTYHMAGSAQPPFWAG